MSEKKDIQKLRRRLSSYRIGKSVRHVSDRCMIRLAEHIRKELFPSDTGFIIPETGPLGDFYQMTPEPHLEDAFSASDTLKILKYFSETHPDGLKAYALLIEIYKRRLRFAHILSEAHAPSPVDLVHRSLIEFGNDPKQISDLLRMRKMVYDIDNRSAQESAYLYMTIMASVLGGQTVTSRNSPILKNGSNHERRSVDCIAGRRAYDFKARMTEAPSRRARFEDEMSFARDCFTSGYVPVLLVLNQLPGQRPMEMIEVFERYEGEIYIGEHAWEHVRDVAGPVLSKFLDKFVHPRTHAIAQEVGPVDENILRFELDLQS